MTPIMNWLVGAWVGFTALLVLLLIYKSTLDMHEDDQLFLDEAESHMRIEQEELRAKMDRLQPFVRATGAASFILILIIGGWWIIDAYQRF
jgi:hypothetical protein